ncbi:MAG TPA: sodium-independent anion transporter [Acidimicrobiaceae bacterium]|nr:sodium-independent anion transporter [Acidimicrobiaceae bacterium]
MGRIARLIPAVAVARTYERSWLGRDIGAGLVLVGMLAPAGMAYAIAAGVPPVTGLYATIIPLLVYALFGPSRILVMGPDSSLAPIIAAAVVPLAAGDPDTAIAVAGALSIVAGLVCVAAGLARFGFLAELLSAPVRYGYLHGIALTILVSQTAKLSGFSVSGETIVGQLRDLVDGFADGKFNGWAFVVGSGCLAVLLLVRWWDRRIPGPLLVVILGIIAALVFDLGLEGVRLVGDLPKGVPTPAIPDVDWTTVRDLLGAAMGVALVSFADTSVLSRTMALRRREHVDANHELVALGMVNVASGMFNGFAVSSSSSRTPVAEAAGSRTQLTGVVAALALLAVTVAAPSTFRHLPDPTLAAIVIAAAISLIDIPAMVRLFRVRRSEFVLAVAGLLAVAVLGPVNGVVVAVALSILNFLRLAWKPHTAELVRVDGLKGYHDRARHPEGRVIPGLLLYRFDAPLFFANARFFVEDLEARIAAQAEPVKCIIVTAEPITDIDTTAGDTLKELLADLHTQGIELRFAELKGVVHDRLDRYHTFDGLTPPEHTARTTGEAVKDYVRDYGTEWTDWEDRLSP